MLHQGAYCLCFAFFVALGTSASSRQNNNPPTTPSVEARDPTAQRQVPADTSIVPTMSTTYDYWWPFLPAEASHTSPPSPSPSPPSAAATITIPTSVIPIIFSLISGVPSISGLSASSVRHSTTTASSSFFSSSQAAPTPAAAAANIGASASYPLPDNPPTPAPTEVRNPNPAARRQVPAETPITPTTSTTYDYWWPFPPADASPTSPPPSSLPSITTPTSVIPIIFSIISATPSISGSTASSGSSSGSAGSSASSVRRSTTTGSASASSSSSQAAPTPSPAATNKPGFKLLDLAPAFGAVGVFLLGLGIWVLYGCCTRRPRVRAMEDSDGALLCGPPYAAISRRDGDVEDGAHMDPRYEEMLHVPKHGCAASGGYRWPSYNLPPEFDDKDEDGDGAKNGEEEDGALLSVALVAPGRRRSSRASRTRETAERTDGTGTGSESDDERRPLARHHSDATSAALAELLSASDDDVEPLRHASIRRGLLAEVEREREWTDTVRARRARAGASAGPCLSSPRADADNDDNDDACASAHERERAVTGLGRRRGHVRADSDGRVGCAEPRAVDPAPPYASAGSAERAHPTRPTPSAGPTHPMYHMPSAGPASPVRPLLARGRRSHAWLKDADDVDSYTRAPARRSRSGGRSESRSRSATPAKLQRKPQRAPDEDVLPQSPTQLMSPALASQMCFTPIPAPGSPIMSAASPTPMRARTKSPGAWRGRTETREKEKEKPTKEKEKAKKEKARGGPSPPLPFPASDGDARADAFRGRLRKKTLPAQPGRAVPVDADDGGSAARRVDHIMEVGWGARDLGREGLRSLSPTGFGREH